MRITTLVLAVAALFLMGGPAAQSSPGKQPACVKKCGKKLQSDGESCKAKGRACLVKQCKVKEKLASCTVDCLWKGTGAPACFNQCSITHATTCIGGCVERLTGCHEASLRSHKQCVAECPEK